MLKFLYSVETNVEQPPAQSRLTPELIEIAQGYGIDPVDPIQSIRKHNTTSEVHVLTTTSGDRFVLRRSGLDTRQAVETQCGLFAMLEPGMALRPLSRAGEFTCVSKDFVWMAYPYMKGRPFSGGVQVLKSVLDACIHFIERLRLAGQRLGADRLNGLPRKVLTTEKWQWALDTLADCDHPALREHLGDDVRSALHQRKAQLGRLIDEASGVNPGKGEVTHYDLQHANVLVGGGGVSIIDIEDVMVAPPALAACHGLFKLARHQVHVEPSTRELVISQIIPGFLERVVGSVSGNLRTFVLMSVMRTIDDLAAIASLVVEEGAGFVLYDLRKKVMNLLEALDLGGFAAEFEL